MIGDIGGVLGQDIAHDLVDGVIAFFLQRLINRGKLSDGSLNPCPGGMLNLRVKSSIGNTTFLSLAGTAPDDISILAFPGL